jgi:hypothetical protein
LDNIVEFPGCACTGERKIENVHQHPHPHPSFTRPTGGGITYIYIFIQATDVQLILLHSFVLFFDIIEESISKDVFM